MASDQTSSGTSWVPGDFEHPNEGMRQSVAIALVFAFVLSTIAVILRLWARILTGSKLYLDDHLIIVALFLKYGCSIGVTILLFNGLGSHINTIPPKNLTVYLKIGWSNSFVYTCTVAIIKLSILALYKRLFATKQMIIATNVMAAFIIMWAVAISVAGVLNCLPVAKFWDSSIPGACMDPAKYYYAQQIPNILSDAILLLMPLKIVWDLPIVRSQKCLLAGVFLLGGLTLVFDIFRLAAMIKIVNAGADVTYTQAPMAVWTCDEAAVGIVAACLPNLRPLFRFGERGFWTQIRSQGQGSGHAHLKNTTITTTTTSNASMHKILRSKDEQDIEFQNYSPYMKGVIATVEK